MQVRVLPGAPCLTSGKKDRNDAGRQAQPAVTRSAWLAGAGVMTTVLGFAKTIEPMIEIGLALLVMSLITERKPRA